MNPTLEPKDKSLRNLRAPQWKNLPIGTRLTLREAAGIIGIAHKSLVNNYTSTNPPRKFPVPVSVVRENGRAILLIREADESDTIG